MLTILSYLCYLFAAVDWGLAMFAGIDITGVEWSPLVAGVVGAVLSAIANKNDKDETEEQ